jgi:hypothetical protein
MRACFLCFLISPKSRLAARRWLHLIDRLSLIRRNPAKKAAYEKEVEERRAAASAKNAELLELQKGGGNDGLEKWKQMKAEGKIDAFTKQREAGERSLGGEGLLPDRIDESMPFIDSGYVDEDQVDVMGELGKMGENLGKMFGGGDKKK